MAQRFRPVKEWSSFPIALRKEVNDLARDLDLIITFVESFSSDSEKVALYLSTCRNAWMTINSMFVSIRDAFGGIADPTGLLGALQFTRSSDLIGMGKCTQQSNIALHSYSDKAECWEARLTLQASIDSALEEIDPVDRVYLQEVLNSTFEEDAGSLVADPTKFYRFDGAESSQHRQLFQTLAETAEKLKSVSSFVNILCKWGVYLKEPPSQWKQQSLFPKQADDPGVILEGLLSTYFRALADGPQHDIVNEALSSLTSLGLPNNAISIGKLFLPEADNALRSEWFRKLAEELQNSLGRFYREFGSVFRPNVSKTPFPSSFVIDLSEPEPTNSKRTEVQPAVRDFEVQRVSKVLIALAHPPIGNCAIELRPIQYDSEFKRSVAKRWARMAVTRAHEAGAQAIVFPELFLPIDSIPEVRELAKALGVGLIAGIEGLRNTKAVYSCQAVIQLPGAGKEFRQFKKYPSNLEPDVMESKGGQHRFHNSEIGSFSVVLCSDYIEFDVLKVIESDPPLDFVVICCCNEHWELWKSLAKADALRLHCFVLISNWSKDTGDVGYGLGSVCVAPRHKQEEDPVAVIPVDIIAEGESGLRGGLSLYELEIGKLLDDRSKPVQGGGWLPPPFRRRRLAAKMPS